MVHIPVQRAVVEIAGCFDVPELQTVFVNLHHRDGVFIPDPQVAVRIVDAAQGHLAVQRPGLEKVAAVAVGAKPDARIINPEHILRLGDVLVVQEQDLVCPAFRVPVNYDVAAEAAVQNAGGSVNGSLSLGRCWPDADGLQLVLDGIRQGCPGLAHVEAVPALPQDVVLRPDDLRLLLHAQLLELDRDGVTEADIFHGRVVLKLQDVRHVYGCDRDADLRDADPVLGDVSLRQCPECRLRRCVFKFIREVHDHRPREREIRGRGRLHGRAEHHAGVFALPVAEHARDGVLDVGLLGEVCDVLAVPEDHAVISPSGLVQHHVVVVPFILPAAVHVEDAAVSAAQP